MRCGVHLVLIVFLALACASPPPAASSDRARPGSLAAVPDGRDARAQAVRTATAMIGAPYRYGGATPRGFDCSGLVLYSYAAAGLPGLPHSAESLERVARPVSLEALVPGDLLFFRLTGNKTSHVAIYVGDRAFVHAPSPGKQVERVSFDHVYWAPRIARAGRLDP